MSDDNVCLFNILAHFVVAHELFKLTISWLICGVPDLHSDRLNNFPISNLFINRFYQPIKPLLMSPNCDKYQLKYPPETLSFWIDFLHLRPLDDKLICYRVHKSSG